MLELVCSVKYMNLYDLIDLIWSSWKRFTGFIYQHGQWTAENQWDESFLLYSRLSQSLSGCLTDPFMIKSFYQFIFHDFIYALQTLPMSLTASTCLKISLPNKFGFGWHFGLIKLITTSIKYIVFLIACSLTSCLCYFWYTSHLTNRRTSAI